MINPGMLGVTPEMLQQAKVIGQHIRARIVHDRARGTSCLTLVPQDRHQVIGTQTAGELVAQMTEQLAGQLYQLFGVTGEIEDRRVSGG